MTIEERMVRRAQEDIIEIGNVAEAMYNGPAGAVIRALANGKIAGEAKYHRLNHQITADRVLGRIEAWQDLIDSLEQYIQDKNDLTRPIQEE